MQAVLQRISIIALSAIASSLLAQEPAKPAEPPTGTVTGQVMCADTNLPARFALVTLEPMPGDGAKSQAKNTTTQMNATAKTDLDGRFVMEKVHPGQYYVVGFLAGYLNPLMRYGEEQLRKMSPETRTKLTKELTIVNVEAGQGAVVMLRLEHASEVSGTISYDDGSPAIGLEVNLLRKTTGGELDELNTAMLAGMGLTGFRSITDDRGQYRIFGAPSGEYAVRATLPMDKVEMSGLLSGGISYSINNGPDKLNMYSGSKFRKKDAATVKVGEGEVVGGVDITVPVASLHTIQGTVTAKRDGHLLNYGKVELRFADDAAEDAETVRSVEIAKDGSFAIISVPEGNYLLRTAGGADTEIEEIHPYPDMTVKRNKPVRNYGNIEVPLLVKEDVAGLALAVPDEPARTAVHP